MLRRHSGYGETNIAIFVGRGAPATRPIRGRGLPSIIAEEAKSKMLRLLRDQHHRRVRPVLRNLALRFRLHLRLGFPGRGVHKLREQFPYTRLRRRLRRGLCNRHGHCGLHDRRRNDGREAGVVDNLLRPLPIGLNPQHGRRIRRRHVCPLHDRQLGLGGIKEEQQREQNSPT